MNIPKDTAGFYVTGFLDLMATKARMGHIEEGGSNEEKAQRLLKFSKLVLDFRDDFDNVLAGAAEIEKKFDKDCPEEQRTRRETLKGNPVQVHTFSDTVVIHSLLAQIERKVPLASVWLVLAAAAASSLYSLVRGVPIRGGIEIGMATELTPGEIFGPAITDAIDLEQQADWPRILLGRKLATWISEIASGVCHDTDAESKLLAEQNQEYARLCQQLLCHDPSGAMMLDLRSAVLGRLIENHVEYLIKATRFAASQYEHFCSLGNPKLAGKYAVLASYLGSPADES